MSATPDTRGAAEAGAHDIHTFGYLCTGCPLGCRLEVDATDDEVLEVRGFTCKRGERYGRQEHTDPRRPVSTTVWVADAAIPRLPVRTSEPVPKAKVVEVVRALRGCTVRAPVRRGQIVLADAAGTGADVVAARTLARRPGAEAEPPG